MKRAVPLCALFLLGLALSAWANPPSAADKGEAARECRQFEDAAGNRENLGALFGVSRSEAVRACRQTQTQDAHRERHRAARQARRQCRADHEPGRARGQCVAATKRSLNQQADQADAERVEAVRACAETNEGRDFGRCVARPQSNENAAAGQEHADQGGANASPPGPEGSPGADNAAQGQTAAEAGRAHRPDDVPRNG